MASIISTISAYFRTHHGHETRTYFGIFVFILRTYKSSAVKKHVPWKAPCSRKINPQTAISYVCVNTRGDLRRSGEPITLRSRVKD